MGKASVVSSKTVTVEGISVEILRKRIKTLRLTVYPPDGRVCVSAPLSVAETQILEFIKSKKAWICRQQEKMESYSRQLPREFLTGETLLLFGNPYSLRVEKSTARTCVTIAGSTVVLSVRGENTLEQRERAINEWYRGLLKKKISELLPQWEGITGLRPAEWSIKRMSTRWGTCNFMARRVWFSLQLAQKSVECLEYVILHELVHLQIPNHGKAFQTLMDRYMPDWLARKRRLNVSG